MKTMEGRLRAAMPRPMLRGLLMSRFARLARRSKELVTWVVTGRFDRTTFLTKIWTIRHYAQLYGTRVFVETGTYLGDMIHAQEFNFDQLFSVELNPELYRKAVHRFRYKTKISIFQGDSAVQMPEIIMTINEPALFWLDAHYSGGITAQGDVETPILGELEIILQRQFNDVILIDDSDDFNGTNDYPTLADLERYILNGYPDRTVTYGESFVCITRG